MSAAITKKAKHENSGDLGVSDGIRGSLDHAGDDAGDGW